MALRKKKSLLDQAADYVDQVRPQVESAMTTALDAVEDFYENTARPALADARDKAAPVLADARDRAVDKATPYVSEARDRAASALHDARDTTESSLSDARAKAVVLAAQAKDSAAARAGELAAQAKETADAQVAHLRGEQPKKKGGKLKKLAIFAALAGVVGFAAKKLQGGGQSDNWQSSYVPTPAPRPAAAPSAGTPAPKAADDAGAAGPDEALADATETPKPVTTPDQPAEVVDIDTGEDIAKKK